MLGADGSEVVEAGGGAGAAVEGEHDWSVMRAVESVSGVDDLGGGLAVLALHGDGADGGGVVEGLAVNGDGLFDGLERGGVGWGGPGGARVVWVCREAGGAPGAGAAVGVEGAAAGADCGFSWLLRWPRWACALGSAGRVRARRIAGAIRLKVMERIVLDVLAVVVWETAKKYRGPSAAFGASAELRSGMTASFSAQGDGIFCDFDMTAVTELPMKPTQWPL